MVKVAEFGMTRREEIVKATKECREDYVGLGRYLTSGDIADAFEEGAEWADKTMIDKACKWITEHIDIPYEGEFIDDSPVASDYVEYLSKRLEYAKAIADAFKQAMEE